MESVKSSIGQIKGLEEHCDARLLTILLPLVLLVVFVIFTTQFQKTGEPQSLWDPIPFAFNTIQFLTNNEKFIKRVT